VGYLARPLGGVIFGHFGDTRGRRSVMIFTVMLMGGATTLMGLLPTTAQAGVIAPIALVTLRVVQGLAVGGEHGSALLVAMEHAPQKRRGLAASIATVGGPGGAVLATVMMALVSTLPHDQFMAWGWRIPFLISVAVLGVGLFLRVRVTETPMFKALEAQTDKAKGAGGEQRVKAPFIELMRGHWRAVVAGALAVLAFATSQGIMTVWGVSAAVSQGAEQTGVLNWKAIGAATTIVFTVLSARISDKLGRRPVLIASCLLGIVLAYPIIMMLQQGTVAGFAGAIVLGNGVVQGLCLGPAAAVVAERFPTSVRSSGTSAAYQLGTTVGAGMSPMIADRLLDATGAFWPVAAFWIGAFAIAAIGAWVNPESKDNDFRTVGR
jgi:MFS family permease